MPIDHHQVVTLGMTDSHIATGTGQTAGIVQQLDLRMELGDLVDNLSGAVAGTTVTNQHLDVDPGVLLIEHLAEGIGDMRFLVEDRHDHRDHGRSCLGVGNRFIGQGRNHSTKLIGNLRNDSGGMTE